jgi:GWxTD domain-containing protein
MLANEPLSKTVTLRTYTPVTSPARRCDLAPKVSIRRLYRPLWVSICLLALTIAPATVADRPAKQYQGFLRGPVSYLITRFEREAFQSLATDDERDRFIERFWEARNPTPSTGQNEFKDEFSRRVAYVNAFYGRNAGSDGWRTGRGRTYLLFGKPRTTMNWSGNQELYPAELWFYSNPGLTEVPAFFYVLFFDKDGIGGYRFYHPCIDGPDKLLRSANGGGTAAAAYTYLKNIGAELAYCSLSLIPGEPVGTTNYTGSMASAEIIRGIQGYNQMPSYVSTIQTRLARLESVTSRVHYDLARTSLLAFLVWEKGEPWVNWQFEVQDPKQPKASQGQARYQMTARLYSGGKLVIERTDTPHFAVAPGQEQSLLLARSNTRTGCR